jgi:predicted membrane chloride channel (bestrophin family)
MKVIVNFFRLVNVHTAIVIALSCTATYLCLQYKVIVDLPTGLIGIAIVFPIVFSINAAYRRREEALRYFASLKAHAIALFYAHRDWVPEETADHSNRMKDLIDQLLQSIHKYFAGKEDNEADFAAVYRHFSVISSSMEKLRDANVSNSEISRCNQYLRAMMIDFERMRNIHIYRTPMSLRAYSQIFLNALPVLFAPYFATISQKFSFSSGFLVAVLYSLVLVSLDNIQGDLEHPYDEVGVDDLNLNVAERYERILTSSNI